MVIRGENVTCEFISNRNLIFFINSRTIKSSIFGPHWSFNNLFSGCIIYVSLEQNTQCHKVGPFTSVWRIISLTKFKISFNHRPEPKFSIFYLAVYFHLHVREWVLRLTPVLLKTETGFESSVLLLRLVAKHRKRFFLRVSWSSFNKKLPSVWSAVINICIIECTICFFKIFAPAVVHLFIYFYLIQWVNYYSFHVMSIY